MTGREAWRIQRDEGEDKMLCDVGSTVNISVSVGEPRPWRSGRKDGESVAGARPEDAPFAVRRLKRKKREGISV
jgi:hypothetical protein